MGASNNISVNVDFKANISQLTSAVGQIKSTLTQLRLPNNVGDSFKKLTASLESELKTFSGLTSSKEITPFNEKEISKSFNNIIRLYEQLQNKIESTSLKNAGFEKITKQVDALTSHWKTFEKTMSSSEISDNVKKLQKDFDNASAKLEKLKAVSQEASQIKIDQTAAKNQAETLKNNVEQQLLAAASVVKKWQGKTAQELSSAALSGEAMKPAIKKLALEWADASQKIVEAETKIQAAENKILTDSQLSSKEIELKGLKTSLERAKNELEQFSKTAFKKFVNDLSNNEDLKKLGVNIDWSKIVKAEDLQNEITKLMASGNTQAAKVLTDLAASARNGGSAVQEMGQKIRSTSVEIERLTQQEQDVQRLYSQLTHFFSISSGVNLFRRAIRSAYDAIKELDAAMTEVAVVTDFSVGDMWDQLPQYTERANELGLAISDVYEASALYYQQGLDTAQVNSMLTSTLHMARIASLDASVATDRMTNAMRGFNMEINEMNSTHVADVYSNLAAKSASNVDELSTAMTKTASIASSANMSFENTAAFLAQGIETTRESADTIGTMLKTVIGRFTEVKKAWTSGDLKAEVDGEEININRVSVALREAGINLNDFFTGARGLDEIFIELSSKWDSLDLVTQRYIATQAAGSRQQSRFIAIMQDYARQQELIGYAYNSAGASQQQYEKTLDSMQTKLNQLKNAWNTFTMGIANNTVIKGGIDIITKLITLLNNLTGALGTTGGMISKIGIAIGGFLLGKSLISGGFKFIVKEFLGLGTQSGTSFFQGFKSTFTKQGLGNIFSTIKGSKKINLTGVFENLGEEATQEFTKVFQKFGTKTDWTHIFGGVSDNAAASLKNNLIPAIDTIEGKLNTIFADNSQGLGQAQQLINTLRSSGTSSKEYGKALQQLTILTEQNNDATLRNLLMQDSVIQKRQEAVQALQSAVGGLTLLATVMSLVGKQFEKAGNQNVGEVFSSLAAAAGIAAMALMVLPGIISSIGQAITGTALEIQSVIPPLLIISGIILAIVAVVKIFDAAIENTEERTERLDNALKNAQKTAEDSSAAYEELKSNIESLRESQDALDGLTEGTDEFRQALINANDEVLKLLETYPMLARYLTTNEYGGLDFAEEGLEAINSYQYQTSKIAQANALAAQMSSTTNARRIAEWRYKSNFAAIDTTVPGNPYIYDENFQKTFEKVYNSWDGTTDIVEAIKEGFEGTDYAYKVEGRQDETALNAEILGWVKAYETNQAQQITTNIELENLLRSFYSTQMSEETKNSDYAILADFYATTNAEKIAEEARIRQLELTNGWGGAGGQITELANKLLDEGLVVDGVQMLSPVDMSSIITTNANNASVELYQQVYHALTGVETEIEDIGTLSTEIANMETNLESLGKVENSIKTIENIAEQNKEGVENFTNVISGHGSEELIDRIIADIGEGKTMGQFADSLGLTFDQLKQLSKNMGYGVDEAGIREFIKVIRTQAKDTQRQQQQERVEAMQQLAMTGGNDFVKQKRGSTLVTNLSLEEVEGLSTIVEHISSALSEEATNSLTEGLLGSQGWGKAFKLEDISWLNDLNLSDAIGSFDLLQQKIDELEEKTDPASAALKEFYKDLQDAPEFDTSHQFTQIYSELSEDLDDLIEKNGEITTDDIDDLVSSNKNLAKFLKNSGIEASVLAKTINGLRNGEIPIQGLTNRVLEFLASLKTTEGEIKKAQDRLSEFEEFDTGAGLDTIKNWSDKVKEYIDNYEYANSVDILEQFFSVEEMQEKLGNWKDLTEDEIDAIVTELGSRMQNLTSNDGFNALYGYYEGSEVVGTKDENSILAKIGTSYIDENGIGNVDFNYDLLAESQATIETLAAELAAAEGISEDVANAIISSVAARDVKLKLTLDENAYENSLIELAESNSGKVSTIYTKAELEAIGASIGKSAEEVRADLAATLGHSISVLDLLDENGLELLGAELHESIRSSIGTGSAYSDYKQIFESIGTSWAEIMEGPGKINLDRAAEAFQAVGLSSEQALSEVTALNEEFDTMATKTVEIPIFLTDENGQVYQDGTYEMTVECSDASSVTETVDAAMEAANSAILAGNIGDAVSDAITAAASDEAIDFSVSVEGSEESIGAVQTALDTLTAESYDVEIKCDTKEEKEAVENLTTKVEQLDNTEVKAKKFTTSDNGTTYTLTLETQNLKAALDLIRDKSYTVTANYVTNGSPASGAGGLLGTAHAGGIGRTKKDETALTGEMGPEMVVTGNQWRTVGNHGPEFAHIPKGSIIFNARQTHDLLTKGRTNTRGRAWASGTAYAKYKLEEPVPNYYGAEDTGSSEAAAAASESAEKAAEASKEAANIWINTLDRLYNLVEIIEEETRRREILEKQYNQLLRDENLTLMKIRDNYDAQLESLENSYNQQKELQAGRKQQLKNVLNEKYENNDQITNYKAMGVDKYARYDMETNTIKIEWDKINAITDEDLGKAVESYISRLEELSGQYEDTQSELYEIEDQISELNDSYRDAYLSLEERVYDAIIDAEEKRIEHIEEVYSQIEENNNAVLDSLREQIDLERQIRDNTQKEEDIADKENQLAYLRRDTSNGNQVEIKQLESELAEMRESYANELIDQKLDKLGEDNEKAAAQREREIQTLKDILEYNQSQGTYWQDVDAILQTAFDGNGYLSNNSKLMALLKDSDGFKGMSTFSQNKWIEELVASFETGMAGLEKLKVEQAKKEGEVAINSKDKLVYDKKTGKWIKYSKDEKGNYVKNKDYTFDLAYDAMTGKYKGINKTKVKKETPSSESTTKPTSTKPKTNSGLSNADARKIAACIWVWNGSGSGWGDGGERDRKLISKFGTSGEAKVQGYIDREHDSLTYAYDWNYLYNNYRYTSFKTGGLADFTGPAWLDGSKTHPELVLNQKDTENFIALKDVLSDILSKQGKTSSVANGDNYFDIDINVEKISDDYDVEQLTDKVKEEIRKDSLYRNVNSLNFLR